MDHPQCNNSGPSNIVFKIENFCNKLMKSIFCLIYPEESEDNFQEIDLEKSSLVINDYTPLKKRNNINIDEIIIKDYYEV